MNVTKALSNKKYASTSADLGSSEPGDQCLEVEGDAPEGSRVRQSMGRLGSGADDETFAECKFVTSTHVVGRDVSARVRGLV